MTTPVQYYTLTIPDLVDYVALCQGEPDAYIGICHSTCACLGASTLNKKYPERTFEIIEPQNICAVSWLPEHRLLHVDFDPEVSDILCEFDSIMEYTDSSPDYKVTYRQLKQAAESGQYPHLAQLFSSPSHLSLSQE